MAMTLVDSVNKPVNHVGTPVIRFFLADFHNAGAVSHLKSSSVVLVLVGMLTRRFDSVTRIIALRKRLLPTPSCISRS